MVMNHIPQVFADRIVNVVVTGSLIRLELAALAAPPGEGEKSALLATQILVMPLEGFLASFGMLEAVVKKMVADGVLKPRPQAEGNAVAAAPATRQ
jgi:hypothetical protein